MAVKSAWITSKLRLGLRPGCPAEPTFLAAVWNFGAENWSY
jgi:hypothetical protein